MSIPRSSSLLSLLSLLSIFSLFLLHPISSSHFEGFDDDPEPDPITFPLPPSPPLTTTLSDPQPDPLPDPHPDPVSDPQPKPNTPTSPFDYWDEDEFEGFPTNIITPPEQQIPTTVPNSVDPDQTKPDPVSLTKRLKLYAIEIICTCFLITFTLNYFIGKNENEKLALAWAAQFATRGKIFDKNFSLLGIGDGEGNGDDAPLLLKEGQNVFKFYASGRRFCQGLVATMELKSRHDLIARLYNAIVPCKDEVTVEVYMNDEAMDHVVFGLVGKRGVKGVMKEFRDLQRFGSLMTVGPNGRKWVADELAVVTESKEVAGDLITEIVVDQVLGEKAFEKFGKWFISMHFSDQLQSTHRKMLVFKFALPDVNHMADMTRLAALVPYYIDLIGRYKLSSQARSKTEAARSKVAQEVYKELQNARQEALQRKKAERRKMMEEVESKLNAEALRKKEARERARQLKKAMPKTKMSRGA